MGLDGFSMGNLGLNTDLTSAQMANQAEQIARKESEIKVKNINESAEDGGVKRKEHQDEEQNQFDDGFKEEKDETELEEIPIQSQSVLSEKDFENRDPKEFSVRINSQTELIELYNNKDQKVLETIRAEDLMYLISKLDSASGVLVNRKI